MLKLLIKGTIEEAKSAAEARDLPIVDLQQTEPVRQGRQKTPETLAKIDRVHQLRVLMWYGEENQIVEGYGYPPGTLLHYSYDETEPDIDTTQGVL